MSSNQQSGETKDLPAGETDRPPGYLRNGIPATSIGGFVVAAAVLLVATPLGTWGLVTWFPALAPAEALIESALNIGVVLPLLLFLFVLPGARNLRRRQAAEGALRAERQDLALRVHERTAELEESNRQLRDEIEVRRAAQGAARESEEQYGILVERLPTGVFIFRNDRLIFVNPKLAEMLEYQRDALLNAEPWALVHPEDRDRLSEIARNRDAGNQAPEEYECRLVTQSGDVRWVTMHSTLIRYRGSPATLGNVQDMTERKRMESQLHHLSARLITVQEEERRRVARDLHDSLGQKLTGIKFLLEASLGEVQPEERRAGVARLYDLVPIIQDAVEEVRRISTELRPSILDDLGLVPTILWHLREFAMAHPKVEVVKQLAAAESEVPRGLRTPIFRILQEATNNAAKHSRATRILVALETAEGKLSLRVQDDGVGFDPAAAPREAGNGGIGMGSMRERAELSGGAFSVSSALGAGTTVSAEWPLDPRS